LNTDDFFERVVYINPVEAVKDWEKVREQCTLREVTVFRTHAEKAEHLVVPPSSYFTPKELAELLSFYKVIRQASIDRINRLLILSGKVKFGKGYVARAEQVFDELPREWTLAYFGWTEAKLVEARPSDKKIVHKAYSATGSHALAINNSFYPLFLEAARIPIYNLNQHIQAISSSIELFVVIPPLVVLA
jgi:hypothetical protein